MATPDEYLALLRRAEQAEARADRYKASVQFHFGEQPGCGHLYPEQCLAQIGQEVLYTETTTER